MSASLQDICGVRCLVLDESGTLLGGDEDMRAVIEEAMGERASVIVLPAARLAPEFFELRTRLAGAMLQKALNYGFRVAVVGDISPYVAASGALRDFVIESNRGRQIWFLDDLGALGERLAADG